jgi:hypothetical protein
MKLNFTIAAALLLTGATANAQLAVESCEADPTDLTARLKETAMTDENSKNCAILKVVTTLQASDFEFDVGMLGVEAVVQKIAEIWVYIPAEAQRVKIQHKHLGQTLYQFKEPLKEATVYVLQLKAGNVKTIVEESIDRNHFVVTCKEEGATIAIDKGEPEPFDKNGRIDKVLQFGKHTYEVAAGKWYHATAGAVEIGKGAAMRQTVELKPRFGSLTVKTTPETGAEIFIDDEKQDKTSPVTVERLMGGEHSIRAAKEMYKIANQKVTIAEGAAQEVTVALQPNFATVTLTSTQGATIYADDTERGATRWSGKLMAGPHTAEATLKGHRKRAIALDVIAGQDQTVALDLEAMYGSLDISANADAAISIDGKQYPDPAPIIIEKLLVGEHEVTLTASGFKPFRKKVEIEEGKIAGMNATMEESASSTQAATPMPTATQPASSTPVDKSVVTGVVTDKNGAPLVGVSVVLKGTTVGTTTDVGGNYSIRIPDNMRTRKDATLVFSYYKLRTIEEKIDYANEIDVTMKK